MEDMIWVLVPLAPFIIGGFAIWTRHQGKLAELQIEATAEKAAQYASHSRELEERVRVLERIITDGGYDTALQIEALRDRRAVEGREVEGHEAEARRAGPTAVRR